MSVKILSGTKMASKDMPLTAQKFVTNPVKGEWVRPADWLTLPTVGLTEQKFVGLLAVTDDPNNFVALMCQVSGTPGTYTVDWGDGSAPDVLGSNAKAQHQYDFDTLPIETLTTKGYKQVIVTVTTAASLGFLLIDLQQKFQLQTINPIAFQNNIVAKWLDVTFGSPTATQYFIGNTWSGPTVNVNMNYLEQITFAGYNTTTFTWNYLCGNCYVLRSVINLPLGGNCNNVGGMFTSCFSLTKVPDFGNSTNARNYGQTFSNCYSLVDCSALENVNIRPNNTSDMFSNCYSLQTVPYFDTSLVTSFPRMFIACYSLQSIPKFNTSLATTFAFMFQNCFSLKTIPNLDFSNATFCNEIFSACYALETVPPLDFRNATDVSGMFRNCRSLLTVPILSIPKATTSASMFNGCLSLIDIQGVQNSANVIDMSNMFDSCSSLESAPSLNTIKVTNMTAMYSQCNAMSNYSNVESYNTGNLITTNDMFRNNKSMSIAPTFNTTKVTGTSSMFNGCFGVFNIPLYDTSNVTNMSSMFDSCYNFKDVPLFNTIKAVTMQGMFQNCLGTVTVPQFNTSNVTTMTSMFNGCSSLDNIPLFDTSKVTLFSSMFSGCRSLRVIPAMNGSNAATNISNFVNATTNLAEWNITGFKLTFINTNSAMLKDAIENMFSSIGSPATTQTVTITGLPGADNAINRSCVLTQYSPNASNTSISTSGVIVGMFATGTGVTTQQTVTVDSTTDRISHSVNSGWAPPDGTRVSVIATSNGLTAYVIYYTRNVDSGGSFQLSLTPDGTIIDLTNNINMTMNFENVVTSVTTNNVSFALPASVNGTQTISFRKLNTNIARLKNWTVTG